MKTENRPEVLISADEIADRISVLADAITRDFYGEEVVLVCVLNGAFPFCSDLVRKINLPLTVDYVQVSSYGDSTESSGEIKWKTDLANSIEGKNVIVVEDIVDTGLTINNLMKNLKARNPKEIKMATLLFKPDKIKYQVHIDYLGFKIEDKFVIGYGLDYAQHYRELPYIGVLSADN